MDYKQKQKAKKEGIEGSEISRIRLSATTASIKN